MRNFYSDKLDCIQLLRAVAAIAVVTQHIPFAVFGDGFWGVDLFFAISGFIMCYVTCQDSEHFFTKRIIRIVPLYWAGTIGIFSLALIAPNLLNTSTAALPPFLKSLAFIPFDKGGLVVPLLFQGWTLNYEMLFYLLFSLSMLISQRYRAGICSALIAGLVLYGQFASSKSLIVDFFTQPILLEFSLGMLCFTLFVRIRNDKQEWSLGWLLVGVLAIVSLPYAARFIPSDERVVKWGILSAIALLAIVLGLSKVKLPRYVVLLGDASYSLYLFHPYVIQFLNKAFKLSRLNSPSFMAYAMAIVVTIACCIFGVLLFKYVEKPMTNYLRNKLIKPASFPT